MKNHYSDCPVQEATICPENGTAGFEIQFYRLELYLEVSNEAKILKGSNQIHST